MAVNNPMFYLNRDWVRWSCGLTVLGDFKHLSRSDYSEATAANYRKDVLAQVDREGTGYVMAAFIDTEVCKEAEAWFKSMWKEVFRSDTRNNRNSSKQFYFVIYDATQKPE